MGYPGVTVYPPLSVALLALLGTLGCTPAAIEGEARKATDERFASNHCACRPAAPGRPRTGNQVWTEFMRTQHRTVRNSASCS